MAITQAWPFHLLLFMCSIHIYVLISIYLAITLPTYRSILKLCLIFFVIRIRIARIIFCFVLSLWLFSNMTNGKCILVQWDIKMIECTKVIIKVYLVVNLRWIQDIFLYISQRILILIIWITIAILILFLPRVTSCEC